MPSRAMIVVGAGTSSRFGADKLSQDLAGLPLVAYTTRVVAELVDHCVVATRPDLQPLVRRFCPDVEVVEGGATRTTSEMAGLAAVGDRFDLIGVHDAARPLVSADHIDDLFTTAAGVGGAIPTTPVGRLLIDRRNHQIVHGVAAAQTPQVFRASDLLAAFVQAAQSGFDGRDTCEVVMEHGETTVRSIPGEADNIKVTFPDDLEWVRDRVAGSSRT